MKTSKPIISNSTMNIHECYKTYFLVKKKSFLKHFQVSKWNYSIWLFSLFKSRKGSLLDTMSHIVRKFIPLYVPCAWRWNPLLPLTFWSPENRWHFRSLDCEETCWWRKKSKLLRLWFARTFDSDCGLDAFNGGKSFSWNGKEVGVVSVDAH